MALIYAMGTGLLAFLAAKYVVPLFKWPRWLRGAIFWPLPFWLYVAQVLVMVARDPTAAVNIVGWSVIGAILVEWPNWFGWAFGYLFGTRFSRH
jgi:hypothetical protein